MTEELSTALRAMAESEPPRHLDVGQVVRAGRAGLARRRLAALGGGTAALAVTGLAVGVLAPAGSAGDGGTAVGAGTPGTAVMTTGALPTQSPPGPDPSLAPADPHDPAVTHWQFDYLPAGMAAYGGGGGVLNGEGGTVWAYADSGFRLQVQEHNGEPSLLRSTDPSIPTAKIPAQVPGAVKAFWMGYADGRVLEHTDVVGDTAILAWERPDGRWLEIVAAHAEKQADWKEETLKAAGGVVWRQRSVPSPIKLAAVPKDFDVMGANVMRDGGNAAFEMNFWTSKDHATAPVVMLVAFKIGSGTIGDWVPPQNTNTCQDANGLTVCISAPVPEPAPLTAIGGPKGLLKLVTSLGNDPANWTTNVLP